MSLQFPNRYRPSLSSPRASQSSARASQSWPIPPQPPSAAGAIARCFFVLFIPLSTQTPSFESISGRQSSKQTLKTRCFRWEGCDKFKNTLHRSVTRVTKYCKKQWICTIWNSSADPADPWVPDYQVSESAVGTLPSTRAGGQDDGSLNKLPQTKLVNDKWYWSPHSAGNPGITKLI